LVPDPIEKWAVWAASPRRMRLPWLQLSHLIRRKLSQAAEPTTQMLAFDCKLMAVEIFGENPLAGGDAFVLRHPVEAEVAPDLFRAFDDEGRAVGREAIGVSPDPAVLGFLEGESEGVEHLGRAEPDELVGANLDIDLELLARMRVAEARIGAVGGDHQIIVAPARVGGIALGLEMENDPKLARPVLQDFQKPLAADADETVARRGDALAPVMDVDIVPMREFVGDDLRRHRIVGGQILDRLVGKDDPPAEGHSGRVALEHLDLVLRVRKLHRDREIETRRAAADAGDLHLNPPERQSPPGRRAHR
jgi:hypothetical protein